MGILFLTTKQERCSDLLLWSAAWLLPPLMLRLIPTTATATATVLALVATTVDMVLATPDMVVMVLATTARGPLRPSPRLMPSTDTELTPTPLPTATLPLPSLPTLLPPLPLATLVLDT